MNAWHKIEINSFGNSILITEFTNDNLDLGYPSEFATWQSEYPDLESALKRTGKSHTGISGILVEVFLNGIKI